MVVLAQAWGASGAREEQISAFNGKVLHNFVTFLEVRSLFWFSPGQGSARSAAPAQAGLSPVVGR